jgi:Holliday junction resolvase RusA-like endonuclease
VQPLTIEIQGSPVPKQRPRFVRSRDGNGNVFAFTPPKTRAYEKVVQLCAIRSLNDWRVAEKLDWPSKNRFSIRIHFFMPDRHIRDLDNCVKSVTDALNKVVFDDDSQIDELYAVRDYDKAEPRTIVVVRVL